MNHVDDIANISAAATNSDAKGPDHNNNSGCGKNKKKMQGIYPRQTQLYGQRIRDRSTSKATGTVNGTTVNGDVVAGAVTTNDR